MGLVFFFNIQAFIKVDIANRGWRSGFYLSPLKQRIVGSNPACSFDFIENRAHFKFKFKFTTCFTVKENIVRNPGQSV